MGATPADMAAGTRAAQIVEWSDAAIQTAWPDARDQRASPSWGAFDSAADAAAALAIKAALIGVRRARFSAVAHDMIFVDPAADGVPCWRLIDAECGADLTALVTRLEIDPNGETTTMELLG